MISELLWDITQRTVIMFRDNLTVLSQGVKKSKKKDFFLDFLTHEEGTDTLCRHIGKELPLYTA